MFEEADNFADLFRGGLPYYLLITLPILIIFSSNPVSASNEFSVQRMSQFDVHGVPYGCRSSILNLEAKSLYTWSTSRHCIITRFQDLSIDHFRDIRAKAGGIIILLPENISKLNFDEKQQIYMLEQAMMAQEISIPVYFSYYNEELNDIIDEISRNDINNNNKTDNKNRESAINEIMNSISANGYQVSVSGSSHSINKQSKIPIIQGELAPMKVTNPKLIKLNDNENSNKLPVIVLTAHLDTFGLYNEHTNNLDVAILLTLADLFSKLYNTINTAPKYKIIFLLSESGALLNFQGMKKWLDVNLDDNVHVQNAEFVMCLDSIGQDELINNNVNESTLYMHVSKPPKDGTYMNNFYKQLRTVGQKFNNVNVEGVHKKINLADVLLAWEHERFSMKRMPAFTISSLKSHKDPLRTTTFKESDNKRMAIVQKNVKIIAEALASYIYNIKDGEIFTGSMEITEQTVRPWLYVKSTLQNNDIKLIFEKYLKNIKIIYDKPDQREPDFMLYDGHIGVLNIYRVKPAVFDLFLTFLIILYLGSVYFSVLYFPLLYQMICKLNNNNKVKIN